MHTALGTGVNAFLTLEAVRLHLPAAAVRQFQIRRAFLRTGTTSFDTGFPVSCQRKQREHRQQCKDSAHGAEHPAEKSFLYTHSHQQRQQDHTTRHIPCQMRISRMEHGKHIPGAGSSQVGIYPCETQYGNGCQHHIFYVRKPSHPFFGNPRRFLLCFFAQPCERSMYRIPKTSESTGKTAEEATKYNRI